MAKLLGVFIALLLASAFALQQDSGAIEARPAGLVAVPGKYIVVLQPGVDAASVAIGHGAIPEQAYSHALSGFAGQLSPRQVAALRADSRVLSIEEDQVVSIAVQATPTGIKRIFAPGNGNIGIDGTDDLRVDVDVAVIDTGIDATHPDLNVVKSVNCTGGGPFSSSCGSGGTDGNGHGTHVGGTIGAKDNGIGVVGVAPGARLWAVKVLGNNGSGYMSWIVAGIDYVTANAGEIEVANMSLGCECTSAAMNTAIANAVGNGVVFVVAAGNSDKDASTFSPANHPDVITVSALADFNGQPGGGAASTCRTDQDDTLADFSNWGATVEIAAPGVCILSTVPGGGYATYSGTSMASPHVAGAAALYRATAANLDKSPAGVKSALRAAGNYGWDNSDDGDTIQEPLLDVSNTAIFNPVMVAVSGGGGGGNAAPTANNVSVSTDAGTAAIVTLSGSDAETCELTFSIIDSPANGTLTGITGSACSLGSPNTDSASVTYTPNENFSGSDSFTYKVNDGTADSITATVSVTVNAVGELKLMSAAVEDGGATSTKGGNWIATATTTVRDGNNALLAGAVVTGTWNGGSAGTCTTGADGTCSLSKTLNKKTNSVTFQVTGVSLSGYTYDGANPSVTINKP
jgi:subtilisin family serine protease